MIRGRQRRFQPFSSQDTGSLRCSCSLRSSPLFIDHDGSTGLTGLSCPARLPFRTCNQHDHSDSKLLFQTKTVPNLNQRNNSRTSNAPPELMLSPTLLSPGVWHGSLTPVSLCQAPGLTFFSTDCSYPTSVPPFLCQLRAIESWGHKFGLDFKGLLVLSRVRGTVHRDSGWSLSLDAVKNAAL